MSPKLFLLLCIAAVFVPGLHCKTKKVSDDTQRARLPEFLTELDLASLEASEEDVESLKKIVKRLAPAKNGEYLMYQGVMGQPGVDFPVLTTIPATKFSCRGLKGGYYADLETNCQVFHICDNGRKISFLCPNGTIFQQSQLICDWWFKVDCGKSADLYEQSAEQLAEEERKRADAKRMNSEFHRASGTGSSGQAYFQSQNQNLDYDGRQNGRTNPFGQTSTNGAQQTGENNQQQQNGRNGNRFGQGQSTPQPSRTGQNNNNNNNNNNNQQQQQSLRQNFNNLNNGRQQQSGSENLNSGGEEYKTNYRSPKGFSDLRNGFKEQLTTTASPFKEYQQPAESAAFATSRNNRYNKSYQYNQFGGNYYSSSSSSSTNKLNDEKLNGHNSFGSVIRQSKTPQAFTPIYNPRNYFTTTTENPVPISVVGTEKTTATTQRAYVNTDIYRQNTVTKSSEFGESVTAPGYRENLSSAGRNFYTESFTQDPSTQKPYVNTDTYRHGGAVTEATNAWTNYDQTTTMIPPKEPENFSSYSTLTTENYEGNTVTGSSNGHYDDEKTFSSSTQRPYRDENGYQEIVVTSRNLSPYDTSVTYKNGKISSTLGPYVPFTKNYAYTTTSTTTTNKPPVYTATVPTIPDNRKPVGTTATPWFVQTENPKVSVRPLAEREHAIEMLHSLQELETTPATPRNGSRVGLNIPPSSGPATLHTLALYFATASENFDSNETATDTAVRIANDDKEDEEEIGTSTTTTQSTASVELPTNLLTQHTVKSYTDLFNKNLGSNVSTVTRLGEEGEEDYSSYSKDDLDNDLDLEQSQGPVSGTNKRGNNPKLRELAQVFTHALSAYLQDPDTFRKVLTEIRPTEPPFTTEIDNVESTTPYPTTLDDYPSATKDKDEVLDFSDVTKATRRKKLTTPYPINSETVTTPSENTYQTYFTTEEMASSTTGEFDESLNEAQSSDFRSSSSSSSGNDFAQEVNHALRASGGSNDVTGPSGDESDSYFPVGPVFSGNRFGGFQNNSAQAYQPYGEGVRPTDATPIGDNYSPESTPASYDISSSDFGDYGSSENSVRSKTTTEESSTTTVVTVPQEDTLPPSSTKTPFIINYFETPTKSPRYEDEGLITAGTAHSGFGEQGNELWSTDIDEKSTTTTTTDYPETLTTQSGDNNSPLSTHWTASPMVTRLWETTVFLDPNRINQGLTGPGLENAKSEESASTTPVPRTTETSTWKFTPNENDAPTAFTLLPTAYGSERTETPTPTFTTHSSIVTTITSSSTSSVSSRENFRGYNVTENEIVKAQEIFGGLNATSSSTLMRVMNQADRNSTVRQLVLLLISNCKGPMNKTTEEEKEQLINALLRMPVNEFSTDQSREIIAGLNNPKLIVGSTVERATSTPASPTTAATVATTYRSRRGRKFRTSTDAPRGKSSNDGLQTAGSANEISIESASPSDNRALELLKSLYTIAAKWG